MSTVKSPAIPPPAPPATRWSADGFLSGPLPGLVAATGVVLALAGLGFGLRSLSNAPLPLAVAEPGPEAPLPVAAAVAGPVPEPDAPIAVAGPEPASPPPPVVGIGGPEEPVPATAGAAPDLLAEAARSTVLARNLAAGDLSRPVLRPVEGGRISSSFGRRADPFTGRPALHTGVDFAGAANSAIVAAGAGVVSWSGGHRGYGNLIEIDHGNGYVSRYGHNSANLVAAGDYVKAGQVIALMGSTGRSTGNHLHFEVLRDGFPVNPVRLIPRR